jgi:Domain of unknown function (DUF4911)
MSEDARNGRSRKPAGAEPARQTSRLRTIVFAISPRRIALFKAIVESYDNLATLRTEDPRRHHLTLYFSADAEDEVRALLDSLRQQFSIAEVA